MDVFEDMSYGVGIEIILPLTLKIYIGKVGGFLKLRKI